jgi:tetratricopeptide (TPR) repeat protein
MSSASLKEEGNALFTKGEFQKASEKYTKAIELDCQNAVLYANRAACALNLKKLVTLYLDGLTWTALIRRLQIRRRIARCPEG